LFTGLVTVNTAAVTFDGTVYFGAGLTLTAIGATFNEPAYFADTAVLSLSATQSVVTLKANTGALVAGAPGAHPWVYDAVLQARTANAVLKPDSAEVTLTFATGTRGITQSAKGLTVSGTGAHITSGATYTVSAGDADSKLTVAAESVLTLGSGALEGQDTSFDTAKASIVLTGDNSYPGTLVLATKTDTSALEGGGKLALAGGTGTTLGESGVIKVAYSGTATQLTAVGSAGGAFTFGSGSSAATTGITGISTSGATFKSIEAPTKDSGTDGTVTFKGGSASTDGTLSKDSTLASAS
jgi:hypothetical protein